MSFLACGNEKAGLNLTDLPSKDSIQENQKPELLIVSDIDDTLKITHVRNAMDLVRNGVRGGHAFLGMPELFRTAAESLGARVKYVSAAAGILQGAGKRFLEKFDFPERDQFFGKPGLFSDTKAHKVASFRRIIQETPEQVFIALVGDNAEKDIEAFDDILGEFPGRRIRAFVHLVYDQPDEDPRLARMTSWLTAFDLGLRWNAWVGLSLQSLAPVLQRVHENLGAKELLPEWVECRDFHTEYSRTPIQLPRDPSSPWLEHALGGFESFVNERCGK